MAKALLTLFISSLILVGCQQNVQKAIQPLTNTSEAVTERYEAERQKQEVKSNAMVNCQELCQQQLSSDGQDFNLGPCLSNEIAPDWVCDAAHSPRQEVDNDPANQCESFRQGITHHFVEVDGNCNVIKAR
ncbi:MAG: hypothetical protein A2731_02375 [Candidatus Buchananbacteria bacterium RIFCSPHIGHO2_01_FULL_39_8]|uniref:Uncharacterized protein n=1 Tax=Candidatus Buchananbacteria bacterium RIFCSPHIGHO2_01_FULL_39_8 TaxID=1797533 RepID=A0A1G1XZY1_9BACT|nr:MAG: hypothetical protein A2731_02375 [Candidatus Buchananbacteria bacterium RIFCSPHIGHO2_01_FULL_39_8]